MERAFGERETKERLPRFHRMYGDSHVLSNETNPLKGNPSVTGPVPHGQLDPTSFALILWNWFVR